MKHAWIKPAIAAVVLAGSAFAGYVLLYARPLAELRTKLEGQRSANAGYEQELKDRRRVTQELRAFSAGTLGSKTDQATARFRTALGAIAVGCGIPESAVVVNTVKPEEVNNPAGTKIKTRLRTELRKQVDFSVMRGTVEAKGTLEQVLRVAAAVQAQPWVHRVESYSVKPEGRERNQFALRLGVATLLMPASLAPKESGDPVIQPTGESEQALWAAVAGKNMFKEPAPVVAQREKPRPEPGPKPPAPPPYDEWRLAGVVESRLGIEALMVNTKNGQRMVLPTGAAVANARFLSGEGERAVFEIGGEQFEIRNGQTLDQRRPATR